MTSKIKMGIDVAMRLISAGTEIYAVLKDKEDITEEELLDIINRENDEQAAARAELVAALKREE